MKKILPVLLLFILTTPLWGQITDLRLERGAKKVDIPFEYVNDFIIVKIIFNGLFPLKFIFDTGAEHTILTRREITDLLRINYQRKFTILGSDMKTELTAYLAQGIGMQMEDLYAYNRSILVLEDDYFRFDEFAGIEVQGILGADLLRRFVVKINYRHQKITLYDPNFFEPPKNATVLPVDLRRNKPYITTTAAFPGDTTKSIKLLVDTGASLPLLLYVNTLELEDLPEKLIPANIGMGLGGFLEGYLGRLPSLDLGPFQLNEIVTSYQAEAPLLDSTYLNNRNGILGNQILKRFVVTLDYMRDLIYLEGTKEVNKKFRYDRSGLAVIASGASLSSFTVYSVLPNSPASEAGVLPGDKIKAVNGLPATFMGLGDIIRKLQKKPGKRIKLKIERKDETIKVRFTLRDLI